MHDQVDYSMRLNGEIEQALNGSCEDIFKMLKSISKKTL